MGHIRPLLWKHSSLSLLNFAGPINQLCPLFAFLFSFWLFSFLYLLKKIKTKFLKKRRKKERKEKREKFTEPKSHNN
jgi:hypothetical protein